MKSTLLAAAIVGLMGVVGFTTAAFGHGPGHPLPKPKKPSKAAEWAADCVYAAMESGYTGEAADIGQFCVEAITVVVNADYRLVQPD